MRNSVFLLFVAALVIYGSVSLFTALHVDSMAELPLTPDPLQNATSTDAALEILPYGRVAIALGQTAVFPDIRITALSIKEDSRCPIDVQCIQAGTVRILLQTVSGMGTSTDVLSLGDTLTTEAEEVTFVSAEPETRSTAAIPEEAYLLSFTVEKRKATEVSSVLVPAAGAACYVGGCSSQICSDRPDAVSTCEYREEYACYQTAQCQRQQDGECGWTQTAELSMCLSSSQ